MRTLTSSVRASSVLLASSVLASSVLLCSLVACKGASPPDATYSTRGEVKAVGKQLEIHHEAIPDYRSRTGKPIGMMSMSMPFDVASGVSVTGVTPGTKVAFTFEVRWSGDPTLQITALSVLPPETPLALTSM